MGRAASLTGGEGIGWSTLLVAGRILLPLLPLLPDEDKVEEGRGSLEGTKGLPCRCEAACAK